ncbi:MAG TPA: ABC transporter permease subunit [Firmicutes bacterium]|nr:ABC transporter permease subunit [Bacillota bacterium]
MGSSITLLKKEFKEILRTYRIYVIPTIFLLFGLTSPIIAKLTPELLKSIATEFTIEIPPPTWLDAFRQFFKNMHQIGVIVVILTLMGSIAEEKDKGTAALVLAKPISRRSFVLAKYGANLLFLAVVYLVSYLGCLYNTTVLFPELNTKASAQAAFLSLVYIFFIASLTLCASTISKSGLAAGGLAIGGFIITVTLPALPGVLKTYSPGALTGLSDQVLTGAIPLQEALPAVGVAVLLALGLGAIGIQIFYRQEL